MRVGVASWRQISSSGRGQPVVVAVLVWTDHTAILRLHMVFMARRTVLLLVGLSLSALLISVLEKNDRAVGLHCG